MRLLRRRLEGPMSEAGLILAINMALGFVLFGAFLGLHFYRPSRGQYLRYSFGFLAGLCSGLLEMALPHLQSALLARYAIFASFLLCLVLLLEGFARQYSVRFVRRRVAAVVVAGLILNVVTLFLARNSVLRMVLYQLPYVVLACMGAWTVGASGRKRFGDRALLVLLALFAVHFASRPAAALASGGMGTTASDYLATIYAVTTQFDVAILTIGVAAALLGLAVADIVAELENGLRRDALTGILNRAGFDASLRSRLAEGGTAAACLVACDLDHFKSINDTFGHATGDAVIRAFADTLEKATRDGDLCARMGGEEFAVLLHNAEIPAARLFVESVRAAFSAETIGGLPEGRRCTASFGITPIAGEYDIEAAYARSDRALYAAKNKGRNRAEIEPANDRYSRAALKAG